MVIWRCFCFRCLSSLHIMQELSFSDTNTLVSIWFRMVSTQIKTRVYKYSLTLTYPPNINIGVVFQFWYSRVGPLIPLLLTLIIDTHAFTCIPVQHWFQPALRIVIQAHFSKGKTNFKTKFTSWLCTTEIEKYSDQVLQVVFWCEQVCVAQVAADYVAMIPSGKVFDR